MGAHTFVATGDSIITRRVSNRTDRPFLDLVDLIRGADSAFTNLEIVTPAEPWVPFSEFIGIHLASPPFILDELKWMGFNLYSAANNHSVDFTYQGLVDTIDALTERGLTHAGAGLTLGQARSPGYLDSGAGRVSLIACASTFGASAPAAASRADMGGRPGISPMRFKTEYVLDSGRLDAIRDADRALGTAAAAERMREWVPEDNPEAYRFLDRYFVEGETPRVSTEPKENDLEDIAKWIGEARRQSDLVVVTIHAHEGQNGDVNTQDMADFIIPMARRWIDAGADAFVGHGPHTLRAIEIYKGKPIFYSLGNFFFTYSTIQKYGSEVYEALNLPESATPVDASEATYLDEEGNYKGMGADPQYWRTVLPVCRFEGRELVGLELHPVELGFDLPAHQRGIPVLADDDEAAAILDNLAGLSEPFGTTIERATSAGERLIGRVDVG